MTEYRSFKIGEYVAFRINPDGELHICQVVDIIREIAYEELELQVLSRTLKGQFWKTLWTIPESSQLHKLSVDQRQLLRLLYGK